MKTGNGEVTPQAVWPVAEALTKSDDPVTPNAVHGPSGLTYHVIKKPT
jgi:hypothetical protein